MLLKGKGKETVSEERRTNELGEGQEKEEAGEVLKKER